MVRVALLQVALLLITLTQGKPAVPVINTKLTSHMLPNAEPDEPAQLVDPNDSSEQRKEPPVVVKVNPPVIAKPKPPVVAKGKTQIVAKGKPQIAAKGKPQISTKGNSKIVAKEKPKYVAKAQLPVRKQKLTVDTDLIQPVSDKPPAGTLRQGVEINESEKMALIMYDDDWRVKEEKKMAMKIYLDWLFRPEHLTKTTDTQVKMVRKV